MRLEQTLDDLARCVRGNGARGILERIAALEAKNTAVSEAIRWASALFAGVLASLAGRVL